MGRSDSSDSEASRSSYHHSKHSKKKRRRTRSRSRSSSSERGSRKKHSSYHRHKSDKDNRRRDRSRSRERSHDRDRSRDDDHKRDKHKHHKSSERRRDRSSSRERSPPSRRRSDSDSENTRKPKTDTVDKDVTAAMLKDKIRESLAIINKKSTPVETEFKPSYEQIEKIDEGNFVQRAFTSTTLQPKPTKKKKGKKPVETTQATPIDEGPKLSHDDAMFGTAADTMFLSRFGPRIDKKRQEELKKVESDDILFGALFCEEPEIRMKRWIERLKEIRKKIREKNETKHEPNLKEENMELSEEMSMSE